MSAAPNGSYVFTGFSGGLTGATSPQNVTMNGPVSVTANFVNPTGLRAVSSTPYFLPFSVDGTPCATGSCLFSAQSGGDTLTVTQTAPPLTGRAPVFQYSAPDGSVAPQEVEAPPVGNGGGGGCPWTCRNGSCSAPIPVGSPQPAPVIASVTLDAAGQIPAVIVAGVPTTIYINGTNFETVPGIASFCIPGGTYFPCTFNANITVEESISSWTNTQIVDVVTMDPNTPPGLWWMFLNVPFWIPAGSGMNPSMGSVEVEAGPTLSVSLNGSTITDLTQTQSVQIGQRIDLLATVQNASGVTYQWTQPPGHTATAWADRGNSSQPPAQIATLKTSELVFAWTDATGNNATLPDGTTGAPVTVTATIPDGNGGYLTLSATVPFKITVPSIVATGTETPPHIGFDCPKFGGAYAMCLGTNAPGMNFMPRDANGNNTCLGTNPSCEWIQVVNSATFDYTAASPGANCEETGYGGDNGGRPLPNAGFNTANDYPGVGLANDSTEVTATESFSTFLMYQPAPINANSPASIWVPIAELDWSWYGDAYITSANTNTWSMRISTPPQGAGGRSIPPDAGLPPYPQWTQPIQTTPCAAPPSVTSVSVNPQQVSPGATATITVTLAQQAPTVGTVVNLSSNGQAFSVPSACTVAAAATTTGPSCTGTANAVTSSTPVTITASYFGSTATATVTVVPGQ